MAFEDRFSPDTAKSPNSGSEIQQNSPESSRTSAYTCQIINHNYISAKEEKSNDYSSTNLSQESPEKSSFFRITSFALNKEESQSSSSSCEDSTSLKYSIHNILQPDFGKSAILKTKTFKPSKIGFKPYEKPAPLGSLCEAVSQIGVKTNSCEIVQEKKEETKKEEKSTKEGSDIPQLWPAWVFCTRYSDRPSSGPRSRRMKKPNNPKAAPEEKRPRTAFSGAQLARLKHEFNENRYLTEPRRQQLSKELGLNEAQIKIWFQNKRAKIKKSSGQKNPLALQLMAQGLYNHSTVACDEDDMPICGMSPPHP